MDFLRVARNLWDDGEVPGSRLIRVLNKPFHASARYTYVSEVMDHSLRGRKLRVQQSQLATFQKYHYFKTCTSISARFTPISWWSGVLQCDVRQIVMHWCLVDSRIIRRVATVE